MEVLIGLVQCNQEQIDSLKLSNASTQAASLIDNVIIGGIRHNSKENCRQASVQFFIHMMDLHPRQEDILFAQRIGEGVTKGNLTFPPVMKVRCSSYFRALVWDKRQILKGQKDPQYHWK